MTARDLAAAPLWLVLTVSKGPWRPEIEALRARLHRELAGVRVQLEPLSSDDLRVLARHTLPHYTEPQIDRVVRRVATDSAGLPLLAVALLEAVAAGLDLHASAAAWPQTDKTLDQTLPGDLPDSVVGAIRTGFRRLSEDGQAVLAAAAVLGERVSADTLARVTGLPLALLEAALDELEWRRWLAFDARGYSFVARMTREIVAGDMVLPGQRDRILKAAAVPTPE
jgi:hypothetical protein